MNISTQIEGHVYTLSTTHDGVYFTQDVTHVIALDDGTNCFALNGEPALPGSHGVSRTQYVRAGYLLAEVTEVGWGDGHEMLYGDCPPITHPGYLNLGEVDLIDTWLRNGIDDIPRVSDIVDVTTMMLRSLLTITLPANAASKEYVGNLLNVKRWNLQHRDDLPVGTVVTINAIGARRLGYLYPDGCEVAILRYKDADGDYAVCRASDYVEGQPIHTYRSSVWGFLKDEGIRPNVGTVEPIGTSWEEPAKALGWLSPEDAQALRNRESSFLRQVREADERHQADITLIGEVLVDEARSREWCSEFEQVVNRRLNPNLHLPLPVRARDVEVVVSGYVRVPFSVTVTVEVDDDSDIDDAAEREFNNNYSPESICSGGHTDRYSAEFEDDLEFEQQD
jgi:hypothetical protein